MIMVGWHAIRSYIIICMCAIRTIQTHIQTQKPYRNTKSNWHTGYSMPKTSFVLASVTRVRKNRQIIIVNELCWLMFSSTASFMSARVCLCLCSSMCVGLSGRVPAAVGATRAQCTYRSCATVYLSLHTYTIPYIRANVWYVCAV